MRQQLEFFSLPPEIHLLVAEELVRDDAVNVRKEVTLGVRDVNSFLQTCTYFSHLLRPVLYESAIARSRASHEPAIHTAAAYGCDAAIEELLRRGVDPNLRGRRTCGSGSGSGDLTALAVAAEHGRVSTTQLLLARGAVKAFDALCSAATFGHAGIARVLLESPVLRAEGKSSPAALGMPASLAAYMGAFDVLRLCVQAGADANYRDRGQPLLCIAVRMCGPDAVRFLLDAGADAAARNSEGQTALHGMHKRARAQDDAGDRDAQREIVRALVAAGCDPLQQDQNGATALHLAAEHGDAALISDLLDACPAAIDVEDGDYFTPFQGAVYSALYSELPVFCPQASGGGPSAWDSAIQTLLERGANINAAANGITTLYVVVKGDFVLGERAGLIHYLLEMGADISIVCTVPLADVIVTIPTNIGHDNSNGDFFETVLHLAAASPSGSALAQLLSKATPADIETRNGTGQTPLLVAAETGALENLHLLLSAGANIEAADSGLMTCLHWAAARRDGEEFARTLLDRCPGLLERQGIHGFRALHLAAEGGSLETVVLLLERGAFIDAREKRGKTPLHFAARRDDEDDPDSGAILRYLIAQGANLTRYGDNPKDRENGAEPEA